MTALRWRDWIPGPVVALIYRLGRLLGMHDVEAPHAFAASCLRAPATVMHDVAEHVRAPGWWIAVFPETIVNVLCHPNVPAADRDAIAARILRDLDSVSTWQTLQVEVENATRFADERHAIIRAVLASPTCPIEVQSRFVLAAAAR